ncbi:Conserved hypothetical protein [Clostridium neonatale]|uniref:hypothetical protein n=1 Tax=Clostridium neonatale TaxID=137838 RepID=UPI00291B59BB|nr:hypothetical protein [Clostridium neonatale]CAI3640194.1 Conserved hypothetical protein [Clostridium neonatale]
MNKNKSIFTFSIIIFICLSLISTYFGGFYPYKDLSPISTSSSEINLSYLIDKLNNPKLNLSSNALSFSTSITLNENDLNNILMSVLKEYKDNINKNNLTISGVKSEIHNNKITILFNAYYHKIPFRGHMIFTPASGSNKIILHLDESKIGFISISKSTILSKISTNNIINVDMNNNEIILNLDKLSGVKKGDINVSDSNLVITFQGEINIYEIINYIILHII